MNLTLKIAFIALFSILLFSCQSSKEVETRSPEDIFKDGLTKFNDNDLIEAKQLFEIIKLQYPASQLADDAQFYLSEIEYKAEKYVLAAFNYNLLRRLYPSSEYSKLSMFKSAMCYYELSPSYDRDQDYTRKAIGAFQDFQTVYAGDSLSLESNKYIDGLRNKLAEREYSTAELYITLQNPRASLVYYDTVIDDYNDTAFFELAFYGKIKSLLSLRRYDETLGLVELYRQKFKNAKFSSEINDIEATAKSKNKNID